MVVQRIQCVLAAQVRKPIDSVKILYTLSGSPLNIEALQASVCQAYKKIRHRGRGKVTLDEMMMSALYQTNMVRQIFVVLRHGRFTRTHYTDSEPTSLCAYSVLNADCIAENQLIVFDLIPSGLETSTMAILPRMWFQDRKRILR